MDIIVGIFLKGAGLAVLWDEALALLVIGVTLFIFSLWVFRRRVQ
jgi:ABC-2 type transport system permease protein